MTTSDFDPTLNLSEIPTDLTKTLSYSVYNKIYKEEFQIMNLTDEEIHVVSVVNDVFNFFIGCNLKKKKKPFNVNVINEILIEKMDKETIEEFFTVNIQFLIFIKDDFLTYLENIMGNDKIIILNKINAKFSTQWDNYKKQLSAGKKIFYAI